MIEYFRRVFAYDQWANRETLAALQALAAPPARAVGLAGHLLLAQEYVLEALAGRFAAHLLDDPEPPLAECVALTEVVAARWQEYLAQPGAADLKTWVTMHNAEGQAIPRYLPDLLTYPLQHAAYHRGQIATLIREAGGTPPHTDMNVYARAFPPA